MTKLGLAIAGVDGIAHVDLSAWSPLPLVLLDGQGLGSLPLAVPAQPALAGAHLWFQSVEIAGPAARLSNVARFGIAP